MHSPFELLKQVSRALDDVRRMVPTRKYPRAEVLLSWFRDRKKAIRDPIYDQITLNELERAVFRTPEFQRLRWVRQMDFAYLVYPAAEHSRFIHSLGVCQAAKELFDRVVGNYDERMILATDSGRTTSERRSIPDFCLFDRVLVSLAALLHDLGHPAFSHAFDLRDDMVKHDDYKHNPFVLRALFDTGTSQLARVLLKWDPFFKVLVRAEAPQLFPESAHAAEGLAVDIPSLATLVFEILSIPSSDDLGADYECICPATRETECEGHHLEAIACTGWNVATLSFSKVKVKTSRLFRRLHCDIVANTISADLLDYIRRDTRVAGLPRDLDRRFYSYISSAEFRGRERVVVELQDRQGHVRRDALSDLMNCMEIRYIIHERIVLHRAVVGARSMAARLYQPLTISDNQVRILELMYGEWGKWRSDAEVLGGANPTPDVNPDIASLLRNRQLYRPIVIIDAERLRRHNVTLPDEAKQRLASKFGGLAEADGQSRWTQLIALEESINSAVIADAGSSITEYITKAIGDAPLSFATCMKPSVLFKNPRILVRVPTSLTPQQAESGSQIEVLDSWLSQVIPLNAHEADQGIYAQIRALNMRYGELWRLYVFAHPILFETNVGRVLLSNLKARWEDEIKKEAAIPAVPLNVSVDDLRSQDVIDRLEDQRVPELLVVAMQLFPSIGLVEAEAALQRSSVPLVDAFKRVNARKEEQGTAGIAAKARGAAGVSKPQEEIAQFEELLSGTLPAPRTGELFDRSGGEDGPESRK